MVDQLVAALKRDSTTRTDYFRGINLSKDDNFPLLYSTKESTGASTKISVSDDPAWTTSCDAWIASHDPGLMRQLARALIVPQKDRKELKPLFLNRPELELITCSVAAMRKIMIKVSKTTFCCNAMLP